MAVDLPVGWNTCQLKTPQVKCPVEDATWPESTKHNIHCTCWHDSDDGDESCCWCGEKRAERRWEAMDDDTFAAKAVEAFAACAADADGRLGYAGMITCPACNGTLKYLTVSHPKGRHKLLGKCDTADCLAWQ